MAIDPDILVGSLSCKDFGRDPGSSCLATEMSSYTEQVGVLGVASAREHNFDVRSRLGPIPKSFNPVVQVFHPRDSRAQAAGRRPQAAGRKRPEEAEAQPAPMSVSQPAFVRPSACHPTADHTRGEKRVGGGQLDSALQSARRSEVNLGGLELHPRLQGCMQRGAPSRRSEFRRQPSSSNGMGLIM